MKELISEAFKGKLAKEQSLGLQKKFGIARVVAGEDFVLSGLPWFETCLHYANSDLNCHCHFMSGQQVLCDQTIAQVDGNLVSLLQTAEVALSLLEFFSSVATQTRKFVNACQPYSTRILNSCKPLPHYDIWRKKAMDDGGAMKHPIGDPLVIGQAHIKMAGSLKEAIQSARCHSEKAIVAQTKTLEEVKVACELKVDFIRVESGQNQTMKKALDMINGNIQTEACGFIPLERIPEIAQLGFDFISMEAFTHSMNPLNLKLIFDGK